jgi:hypothetical protein
LGTTWWTRAIKPGWERKGFLIWIVKDKRLLAHFLHDVAVLIEPLARPREAREIGVNLTAVRIAIDLEDVVLLEEGTVRTKSPQE